MPSQTISLKKIEFLKKEFERLEIKEKDIEEHFIRSPGNGGQNVNKVSSAVYLKHIPSKIEIKCSKERTQYLNRFFARRLLAEKLEELILGEKSKKRRQLEKIKRQKRKRTKRAKEKILKVKKLNSEKKENRKKVDFNGR